MIWLGPIDLDVECTKLSSAEFRGLVSEVSEYLLQLPFGYRGAGAGYEHVLKFERSIDYHILVHASNLLRSNRLQAAVAQITADPHVLFVKERQRVRVERARRADSVTVRDICVLPRHFEPIRPGSPLSVSHLCTRLEGKHFPGQILSGSMVPMLDNEENQFVRHTLESILRAVGSVLAAAQSTSDIRDEARWIQKEVECLLAHDLFQEVSRPRWLNLSSQVLQRRAGYREMLMFHLQMALPPTPAWSHDLKRILELKDVATLYEYWVFVQIGRGVEKIMGAECVGADGVEYDPFGAKLRRGIRVRFPGGVEVHYNKGTRGYSGPLRPDVMLLTQSGMWAFDAKFRLDSGSVSGHATKADTLGAMKDRARVDDIDKMHTYRDALTPGLRGAYVVYPGDEVLMYPAPGSSACNGGPGFRDGGPWVAVDGVGAVPARPGSGMTGLFGLLDKILSLR
jgi:predicted component of viral defense system (DUF524 family)